MARRMNNLSTCNDVDKSQKKTCNQEKSDTQEYTLYGSTSLEYKTRLKTTYSVRCQIVPGESSRWGVLRD